MLGTSGNEGYQEYDWELGAAGFPLFFLCERPFKHTSNSKIRRLHKIKKRQR